MEQRVSLITLGVADLEKSRKFYEDGLGWQPGLASDNVVFFQLNGLVLALFPAQDLLADAGLTGEQRAPGAMSLAHNVRSRNDVDLVLAEAARAGATILKPANDTVWGGYAGYFADPDGHLWEIAWNPSWPIDEEGRVILKT